MPLRNLTQEQTEAVLHDGNLLLTACPGSGKTKTLVSKIAYTLMSEKKVLGKRKLAAITYTNTAADTIMDRLDRLGVETGNLWLGTIHSFCMEWIIKPYSGLDDRTRKRFRILDEYEYWKLVNEIKKKYKIGLYDDFPTALNDDHEFDAVKDSNLYFALLEYHKYLLDNKYIDFDLILSISSQIIGSNPEVGIRLAKLFSNFYIDEYQDTNGKQYEILGEIIKHKSSIVTLIGDVDQAIYTTLGAVVKKEKQLKLDFNLDHIDVKHLSGCFRSTQEIIDFYKNFQDEPIDIRSKIIANQAPSFVNFDDSVHKDDLADYVINLINTFKGKVELSEIVVVAPTWRDVINLAKKIREADSSLPLNAPSVSPIPRSIDNYWYELVNLYFMPISPDNYSKRRRVAKRLLDNLSALGFIFEQGSLGIKGVIKTVNSLELNVDDRVSVFVESLIQEFCSTLNLDISSVEAASEARDVFIDAIRSRVADYEFVDNASSLKEYYRERSGVSITTYQQTKGEEYEVVIASGLLKGKLPHWNNVFDGKKVEDYVARRLLYVICSRAKRYLYLVSEAGHKTKKGGSLTPTEQLTKYIR
jgi:DNA helicase-2/ATP-dependent DNA helicase PcrA